MTYEFFPGANSPTGFFSRFDPILADPALRRKLYIKGGPGCGKSTLMRRLAQLAADHGADTVQGLCASDPDSLDLLLIPQAGFAICDATAPHVCEPPLCGCDGVYCDLGRFYTPDIIEHSFELKQLKQAHSACYTPARHALTAVQAICRQRTALIDADRARRRVTDAAAAMAVRLFGRGRGTGRRWGVFFTAVTPRGCIARWEAAAEMKTVYLLRDTYRLAPDYLGQLADLAQAAGQRVIAGHSPLFPAEGPEQLILPDCGAAFLRRSSHFPPTPAGTHVVDLDERTDETADARAEARHLRQLSEQLLQTAVGHLQRAKALHDELESVLHPYVDFAGVQAAAEKLARQLEPWLTEPASCPP